MNGLIPVISHQFAIHILEMEPTIELLVSTIKNAMYPIIVQTINVSVIQLNGLIPVISLQSAISIVEMEPIIAQFANTIKTVTRLVSNTYE